MNANSVFLSDLRSKAKRKGAPLEELLEEIDRAQTGHVHVGLFRKLVANTGLYVDDERFADMVGPYTKNEQFFYAQFVADTERAGGGGGGPRLSDAELREFGAPLRDRGVDLVDFLRQWDRARSGRVAAAVFLRNVSSTPLGQAVCRAYTSPVTGDVEYASLWADVERVLAAKYSGNPIDPRRMQELIDQFADIVKQRGVDLFAEFQRLDRLKKRRIPPAQFAQVVAQVAGSSIAAHDVADLADTFTENAVFDYVSFCDEVDRSAAIRAARKPPPPPVEVDVEQALRTIAKEVMNRHSQLRSQLQQLDPRGAGLVASPRFVRAVLAQNFSISDSEVEAIAREFSDGRGNTDYLTFFDVVMPPQPPSVSVEDVLLRLQNFLNGKKLQIKPKLAKYDMRNKGSVQFTQLLAVLREINFDINMEEANVVKAQFAHGPANSEEVLIDEITRLVDPIIEPPKPRPTLPRKEFVEPATAALEVMTKVGAIVSRYKIDIFEDFKRYDTQGIGLIKDGEFLAVLASLPGTPSDTELEVLVRFYSNPTTHDINYESFCQEMDEFAMRRLQQNPEITTKLMSDLPAAPVKAKEILKRLKLALYAQKTPPDALFAPYDGGHSGLIPDTKLKQILDNFGFPTSADEIACVINAFRDTRMPEKLSYRRLCAELNAISLTQSDLAMAQTAAQASTKQTTNPEVLRITGEFREKLLERHKRVAMPFAGIRQPAMPALDFRRCVESFGLVIKETDMQKILREYKMNMQGDIDWQRFVQDVEAVKTV